MNSVLSFHTSGSTSASLLIRVRGHDPDGWTRLTKIYGPLVYGWARRAHLQPADAADVVQEVFQAASKSIDSFDQEKGAGRFRGWLWGIAKHKLNDHFRYRFSRPEAAGGSNAHVQLNQLPEAPPEETNEGTRTSVITQIVHRALALIEVDFATHTWKAFLRATVDGHPPSVIASEMGMSVAAVYKAKSRVLARLREELSGLE